MGLLDRFRGSGRAKARPDRVVDVAGAEARLRAAAGSDGKNGVTVSCPKCSADGALDRLDLVAHVADLHCTRCGYAWQVDEAELTGHS